MPAGKLPILMLALLLPTLLGGCKLTEVLQKLDKLSQQPDPFKGMAVKPDPAWSFPAGGPVIKAGDYRAKGLWNDPSVLKTAHGYAMYLTTSVKEPFKPPVLPFRAVSSDGIHWRLSPTRPLLSTKGTPFVSLETPSVVRFHGCYHLYYTGVYREGMVPPMAVGHAVSKDGIHWTSDHGPVLKATGNGRDWNGYLVGEPGAVVFHNKLYLYFSAVGARASGNPPQKQTIGVAVSSDGSRFGPAKQVLAQAALYPADKGFAGYSTPTAVVLNGRMHLVFDVAFYHPSANPQWQQVALHHAWSRDGAHFVQDKTPLFTRKNFDWTGGEILAPTALVENGTLKVWFAGHVAVNKLAPMINRGWKGGEFGIGYATLPANRFPGASH